MIMPLCNLLAAVHMMSGTGGGFQIESTPTQAEVSCLVREASDPIEQHASVKFYIVYTAGCASCQRIRHDACYDKC